MPRFLIFLNVCAGLALLGQQQDELGLEATSQVDRGDHQITARKYKDVTGAFAASLELPGANREGNYVLTCVGKCPDPLDYVPVGHRNGPLPVLHSYLSAKGLVAGSERYVLGPEGLARALPQVSALTVAFQFGTEGEIARYRSGKNEA